MRFNSKQAIGVSVLAILFAAEAQAFDYNGIVAGGDSITDNGNVFAMTGGAVPYPSGRFSNGPVWIEKMAADMAISLQPSLLGGTNLAYGGAETGMGTALLKGVIPVPNVGQQVHNYLTATPTADPKTLYVVFGGANDFFNGQINPAVPAMNMTNSIVELANAGAKRILVVDLPNLGLTPAFHNTPNQSPMTMLSLGFNAYLTADLQTIPGALVIADDADKLAHPNWDDNSGLTIFHYLLNDLFEDMINNPAKYDLTNVTDAVLSGTNLVGDPSHYLFWDSVHPTTAAQAYLGNAAYQLVTVPEPATLGLLSLSCVGFLRRRRRELAA